MIKVKEDLTGRKFERLTVIKQVEDYIDKNGNHLAQWLCKCDCGNEIIVKGKSLKSKNTKSCGCMVIESAIKKITKYNNDNKKHNTYDLFGEYGIGYTTKGEEFYFDLEDYEKIKDYCWWINDGYVCTKINKIKIKFHKILFPNAEEVDHKNHKTNDNRKTNLRPVTHTINMMNKKRYINNTSGVTGVYWTPSINKWVASVNFNKQRYTKTFSNFNDAVTQRKIWENEFFREYSYDNSINDDSIKEVLF